MNSVHITDANLISISWLYYIIIFFYKKFKHITICIVNRLHKESPWIIVLMLPWLHTHTSTKYQQFIQAHHGHKHILYKLRFFKTERSNMWESHFLSFSYKLYQFTCFNPCTICHILWFIHIIYKMWIYICLNLHVKLIQTFYFVIVPYQGVIPCNALY